MFKYTCKILSPDLPGDCMIQSVCSQTTLAVHNDFASANRNDTKVYKRRLWMLSLYCILAMLNAMLFPQFVSMANVTGCYYGITQSDVNWTVQIYMVVYVVLVIPSSLLMNYMDLRWTLICGSSLNTIACILQFLTVQPEGFPFVIVSSFIASLSSLFVMGVGPFLAARWFPSAELSRACAVGLFGNQIGVSVGLIFSPLMVSSDCALTAAIRNGKMNVAYILTAVNTLVLILLLFTFQVRPKIPPSLSQRDKKEDIDLKGSMKCILAMMKNSYFIMIFLLSGIMGGSFFAFTTVANDLMIRFFPGKEVEIAWMNTFFSLMGIVGSITAGYILDYTHRFKETTIAYCTLSLLFYIFFSGLLYINILWIQYISFGVLGFFLAGFLPIGLEYGIEIIFPISEMFSSNLQFWSMQAFGIVLIQIVSQVLDRYGPIASNVTMAITLLICSVIASFLTKDYKRSKKVSADCSIQITT